MWFVEAVLLQSPFCNLINESGSKSVFQSGSVRYLMLYSSLVLLLDVFQEVTGFKKTPFPPGKQPLHLFRQLLRAEGYESPWVMTFPHGDGWILQSPRLMLPAFWARWRKVRRVGNSRLFPRLVLTSSLLQNLTHNYVLSRQKDCCCLYPVEKTGMDRQMACPPSASRCSSELAVSYRAAQIWLHHFYRTGQAV